jgi:hypothetical protein
MSSSDKPFLGTVDNIADAFPEIDSLKIVAHHRGMAISQVRASESYTLHNLPRVLPCANPRCQQGGYDLNAMLIMLTSSKQQGHRATWYCGGHEGTPKGRRRGLPCSNSVALDFFLSFKTQ